MSLTPNFLDECRDQNILILEPFFYTPHLETSLELAERLSQCNRVTYVGPDALRCVTDETYRITSRLLINISRKRRASSCLRGLTRIYSRGEIATLRNELDVPSPETVLSLGDAALGGQFYENFDLGMGIMSSLLSLTRDIKVRPADHKAFATALATDALALYVLTKRLIRDHSCDMVMLFNGRFAPVRAIRRACEAMGTRYIVHERGSSINKFALFDRATPHQPQGYRRWADEWWGMSDNPERTARAWLEQRQHGAATNWYSFTGRQEAGQCPPRQGRKRVTFFTSSEDELAAIGDELRPDGPFCEQTHAIRAVGGACRERGYEFIVRFHPNTSNRAQALIAAAKEASESVFEPASTIDTYALIKSTDIIFTQNSTVGIESASQNKPVFYCGRNIFEQCQSVHRIMTNDDLALAMDVTEGFEPLDALRYANFFASHGIAFRHYVPTGIVSGRYEGRDLNFPLTSVRNLKLRLTRGGI